ncbi:hypothetical protein QSH24_14740 [Proteus faecis]|nr:hypothetical protein [Proteus faecis]
MIKSRVYDTKMNNSKVNVSICQRPENDESRQYTRFIKENLSQKRGFSLPFVLPLKVKKISVKEGNLHC